MLYGVLRFCEKIGKDLNQSVEIAMLCLLICLCRTGLTCSWGQQFHGVADSSLRHGPSQAVSGGLRDKLKQTSSLITK